jgi:integrase
MESVLLDAAGHRRSPATMPGYHRGRPPRNKGEEYPADPPTVEEFVAVMRAVGDRSDAHGLRALIVLLWRAGLRISEALALQESDLDRGRGAVLVRRGKGGTRREVGMDRWAWDHYSDALVMDQRRRRKALVSEGRNPVRRALRVRDLSQTPKTRVSTISPRVRFNAPSQGITRRVVQRIRPEPRLQASDGANVRHVADDRRPPAITPTLGILI